jgi:N-acyl-D-aspartate/D-glutamate deacylase
MLLSFCGFIYKTCKLSYNPVNGRIEEGCDGDITVFDPETIRDGATFTDIHIKPEGIQCVLINGKKALEGKEILNGRLGRFISSDEMGID